MAKRFAKRMKGRLRLRDGGSPINNQGWFYSALRPNAAGMVIDELTSLNLAAIWRGVNVKAGDLAKLPLNIYERLEGGGKRPDFDSPIYELLSYPNDYRTGRKQRHAAACHLILWGNSYQEILRDPESGVPDRLELLDPRRVEPRRDHDGRLTYWLKGSQSPWTGKKTLLPENVVHFSGLSLNGDNGVSPIQTTSESLGTATALDKYAGSLWGNGAVPNGAIECPPGWPDDARNNFRQAWQDEHGGVGQSNRTAILEEGAKWVATSFDPEKLQMLSSRQFSVLEIARIIGIPPHKLFDMSNDIERGLEESNRDYFETEIDPICQGMADEYGLKLLTVADRRRSFVGFDFSRLMVGKALERAQTNDIKLRNGVITTNEWRAEEGLNPFEKDIRFIPLNMQVVDDATDLDPDPSDEGPSDPEPIPLAAETRAVLREALGRMVRREVATIRRVRERGEWGTDRVDECYPEAYSAVFVEAVSPALALHGKATGLDLDATTIARSLVEEGKAALAASLDVEALLGGWEATKVDDILKAVEARP